MADTKISLEGSSSALSGTEQIPGVQSGGNVKITASQIKDYAVTIPTIGAVTTASTAKATPVDADTIPLNDSAAANALKKVSWLNIKAVLKIYFDTLYTGGGGTAATTTFTPAGNIVATNVQTAIQELDSEKQPLDTDLTDIAAIAPSNDDIIQRKAGAWTNRTPAQVKSDLVLVKGDVGLSNVDNTSDVGKPVSTAQAAADAVVLSSAQGYADSAVLAAQAAIKWKNSVVVATTANITLSGEQTIDGILTSASRVLVKNQSTASQNGIYVSSAGAWARSTDADSSTELQSATVSVEQGSSNANTTWLQTADSITVGSTSLTWSQFGSSVPDATSSVKGITKLYTATGSNTDGSMDQNSITNAIPVKATASELTTGSNDAKFATALALENSKYLNQNGTKLSATATGTDTYVATITPAITAYVNTHRFFIRFTNANTGAATLNLNSLGAIPLRKNVNEVLIAGDIPAGSIMVVSYDGTNFQILGTSHDQTKANLAGSKVIQLAASDEGSLITAGTSKITFRMPYAMTVSTIRASLTTAQTSGSIFTVDVNEGGVSILSTKITIDNTEKTSTTAATAPVLSDTSLADDAEITIDVDQIGDSTAKGLKITLIGS